MERIIIQAVTLFQTYEEISVLTYTSFGTVTLLRFVVWWLSQVKVVKACIVVLGAASDNT